MRKFEAEEGVYEFVSDSFELKKSESGKIMTVWRMRCAEGEQAGSVLAKPYFLHKEGGRGFFRKEMALLGIDVTETSTLKKRLAETHGTRVKIRVKMGNWPQPSYYLDEVCGRNPEK